MFFIKLLLLIFVVITSTCIAYKGSDSGHYRLKPLESEIYFNLCHCFKEEISIYFIKSSFLVNLYHSEFAISFFCKSDNYVMGERLLNIIHSRVEQLCHLDINSVNICLPKFLTRIL